MWLLAKLNETENPHAIDALMNHIYMDDIVTSNKDVMDAQVTMPEVDKVLQQQRFNIKAWHSNNKVIDKAPNKNSHHHSWPQMG